MRAAALMLFSLLLPSAAQQRAAAPIVSQVRPLPDEAVRQNARLAANLSPSAKSKVQAAAAQLAATTKQQPAMTTAQLQNRARASVTQAFPNLRGMDIDAVVFLVMMQCAQDQQSELQQAMNQMQQNTKAKQAARQQNDMNQEQQLQIQMEMDQLTKVEQMLSNVMKSASDTQSNIIANLK
jgi:hypothetical protein